MSEELYQITALAMRYWFAFLGVLIAIITWVWLLRERGRHHRRLRELPDAGTIGDLLVLEGSQELAEGTTIPLPYEGVLGCLRTCDLVVPCNGVAARHLILSYVPMKGVLVQPFRGRACVVDGEEITHRSRSDLHPLWHGSILQVGQARLRVRFFRGIEAPAPARLMEDEADGRGELPGEINATEAPASEDETYDKTIQTATESVESYAGFRRRRHIDEES